MKQSRAFKKNNFTIKKALKERDNGRRMSSGTHINKYARLQKQIFQPIETMAKQILSNMELN